MHLHEKAKGLLMTFLYNRPRSPNLTYIMFAYFAIISFKCHGICGFTYGLHLSSDYKALSANSFSVLFNLSLLSLSLSLSIYIYIYIYIYIRPICISLSIYL